MSATRVKTSASQAFGSMLLRAVMISVTIAAAQSAPRSEPAKSQPEQNRAALALILDHHPRAEKRKRWDHDAAYG
jgi:hypothetical protein